jgi:hypothetical protein
MPVAAAGANAPVFPSTEQNSPAKPKTGVAVAQAWSARVLKRPQGTAMYLFRRSANSAAYPRLVVWTTVLTEDKMNELIAKGAILDGARKAGFRMLVFVDKGQDRNWYFDLTKPANIPLYVVSPPSPAWMRRSSR